WRGVFVWPCRASLSPSLSPVILGLDPRIERWARSALPMSRRRTVILGSSPRMTARGKEEQNGSDATPAPPLVQHPSRIGHVQTEGGNGGFEHPSLGVLHEIGADHRAGWRRQRTTRSIGVAVPRL